MSGRGTVYLVQNKINGKVYVGITENPRGVVGRYSGCKFKAGSKRWTRRTRAMDAAFIKYGADNFIFQDLMVGLSRYELDFWERYFIKMLGSDKSEIGYNRESGGFKEKSPSAESREKNRLAHLGKKQTQETIVKRSASLMGRICSEDTRKKIGDANRGRKPPLSTIEASRRIHTGRKKTPEETAKRSASLKAYYAAHPEIKERTRQLGFSMRGFKRSSESRKQQSERMTGKKISSEHASKLRASCMKIRRWVHPEHGSFVGAASELVRTFPHLNLSASTLGTVANGTRKNVPHHKGWKVFV